MKTLLKIFAYLLVMLALVIFFLPKVNLYYKAEEFMLRQKLSISNELVRDSGVTLEINNGDILFDKLALAHIDSVCLSPWLFYNRIRFQNIHVNEGFSDFLPEEIEDIVLRHVVYNPTKVELSGKSGKDLVYGEVDLLERVVRIHLQLESRSEEKYRSMLARLNKEEGGYLYEYKF